MFNNNNSYMKSNTWLVLPIIKDYFYEFITI